MVRSLSFVLRLGVLRFSGGAWAFRRHGRRWTTEVGTLRRVGKVLSSLGSLGPAVRGLGTLASHGGQYVDALSPC